MIPQDLFDAAKRALKNSYSPYSHYKVGCALRAADGTIYNGCNVENASYSIVQCAEGSAVGNMITNGQLQIKEALVLVDDDKIASPCGSCRQRLSEFADGDLVVHMCTIAGQHETMLLKDLLPLAFKLDHE